MPTRISRREGTCGDGSDAGPDSVFLKIYSAVLSRNPKGGALTPDEISRWRQVLPHVPPDHPLAQPHRLLVAIAFLTAARFRSGKRGAFPQAVHDANTGVWARRKWRRTVEPCHPVLGVGSGVLLAVVREHGGGLVRQAEVATTLT